MILSTQLQRNLQLGKVAMGFRVGTGKHSHPWLDRYTIYTFLCLPHLHDIPFFFELCLKGNIFLKDIRELSP